MALDCNPTFLLLMPIVMILLNPSVFGLDIRKVEEQGIVLIPFHALAQTRSSCRFLKRLMRSFGDYATDCTSPTLRLL